MGKQASKNRLNDKSDRENDVLTVIAISVVVYALASLLHEGVGHGGACVLVGCRPLTLTSMSFNGNADGLSVFAGKMVPAGGPIVSTVAGLLGFAALRGLRKASAALYYFVWLLATVNLMQGTGYFLFSGVGGVGDLAAVIGGWYPAWLWRVVLVLIGVATYYLTVILALTRLGPLTGGDPVDRRRRALTLMLIPFFTGGALEIAAGLFNPGGLALMLLSGVAATLGGTSGLAWGTQLLRGAGIPLFPDGPRPIARSGAWIAAAVVIGAAFIAFLGPGIALQPSR